MKLLFTFMVTLLSVVSSAYAEVEDDCHHTSTSFSCVTYEKNYDGDTITFAIPQIHAFFTSMSIRLKGIDTPERRSKDICEKVAAGYATDFVREEMTKASRINLINVSRGKYFRLVADVMVDGVNLSELLLQQNLAVPYDGGTKPKVNWCDYTGIPR